jgi:serine/threonine-protein kinase
MGSSNELRACTLAPGTIFHGRYRVVRCIKAGGMGAIYEVFDQPTASTRALKVMLPSIIADPDLRARFSLEATVTGSIHSEHIVRVSDAGVDDASGTPFLVMDLLQGEELGRLAGRRGLLPPEEVVLYLTQAARGLERMHAAGVVHRDLKPENLFITERDDGSPCVKILDFGIAKVVAKDAAHATRALGTPLYMSPEQIGGAGTISAPTDVYALGQIAYRLLVGEPYWTEESEGAETVYALISKMAGGVQESAATRARRRRNVVLPSAFDAWFAKATAVRPEGRFGGAMAAVTALAKALGVALHQQAPIAGIAGGAAQAAPTENNATAMAPPTGPTNAAVASSGAIPRPTARSWMMALALLAVGLLALGIVPRVTRRSPGSPSLPSATALPPPGPPGSIAAPAGSGAPPSISPGPAPPAPASASGGEAAPAPPGPSNASPRSSSTVRPLPMHGPAGSPAGHPPTAPPEPRHPGIF